MLKGMGGVEIERGARGGPNGLHTQIYDDAEYQCPGEWAWL